MNVCTFEPRIPDPVRTIDRTTGPRPIQHTKPHTGDCPRTDIGRTRPETQQNLIHTDKEQHDRHQDDRSNGVKTRVGRIAQAHIHTELEHSAIQTNLAQPTGATGFHRLKTNDCRLEAGCWFYRVCFANAGGGDNRDRTDDPLLAKQVLSQLSYAPNSGIHLTRTTGSSDPQPATQVHPALHTTGPARPYWWAREDLNLRPHAYQACALTS